MSLKTVASGLVFEKPFYEERLRTLRGHDVFLGSSADAEWLTGVPRIATWSEYDPGLSEQVTACFIGDDGPLFSVAHALWHLESGEAMRAWGVLEYTVGTDPIAHLRTAAKTAGWNDTRPIHVPAATPVSKTLLLREAFPKRELRTTESLLGPLRACKSEREIELMRMAAGRTNSGIREACARLHPGVTRLQLLSAVRDEILAQGIDDIAFGPDCWAIGPEVAIDWSNAATKNADPPLTPPCSVSLDVGARLSGYGADVGRTIFIGDPPARSAEALTAITEARLAGAPALRPGRLAHEVDELTRAVIADHGFGPGQWIPSGHGIGLELHEPPVLGERDKTPLSQGNVVTFELAIWQQGVAGAFAEDTVVIGSEGLDWLIDDGDEPLIIG